MDHSENFGDERVPRARRVSAGQSDGPELVTESIWHNPTDRTIRLDIYVGVDHHINFKTLGRRPTVEERTGIHVYEIGPKETKSLSSEYDKAIQDVRDGVIVGGLGPMLRKKGSQAVLHPALDDALARHKAAVEAASEAMLKEKVHAQAVLLAQAEAEKARVEIGARDSAPDPKSAQGNQTKK